MRILIFFLCLLPQITFAQSFETMAIVHDGRVKPMDTFARQVLESIYGQDSFEGQTASEWMQGIVADPQGAVRQKIFFIENEALKNKLGLNADQNNFNAQQLATVFTPLEKEVASLTKTENLTPNETALLELYDKTVVFATLLRGEGIVVPAEVDDGTRSRLKTEVLYNQWRPFVWVKWGYGLLIGMCVILLASSRGLTTGSHARQLLPFAFLLSAVMLHAVTLVTRIYILGRPPVATLYESVLFVALIAPIIALILSFLKPRIETVLIGAVSALILLIIAPYTVKGIDDMAPIAAVLNTNFWLGIHVLCITSGYALCILTALVAHLALLKDGFARLALILSMIALFFVATGTVLGGIWADQSWGRFWGWDPKENGALLIVLWLTWLHHGRLGTMISERWFLAGLAFLNVVVALAWFGVNLLGVGLHSYGFADGLAWGLSIFCVLQTIVILALLYKNIKRVA